MNLPHAIVAGLVLGFTPSPTLPPRPADPPEVEVEHPHPPEPPAPPLEPGTNTWNRTPTRYQLDPPLYAGRIELQAEPLGAPGTNGPAYFLAAAGDVARVGLFRRGDAVGYTLEPGPGTVTNAATSRPGPQAWAFVFGAGQCHFELDGQQIGETYKWPTHKSLTELVAGGALPPWPGLPTQWRALRVTWTTRGED